MDKIRVLLADDHAVLRAGLKALLNAELDIEVVAEASDGLEAVMKTKEICPDVIILDLSMPKYSGIKCAKELQNESKTRILILTMHDEEQYLKEVLSAGNREDHLHHMHTPAMLTSACSQINSLDIMPLSKRGVA